MSTGEPCAGRGENPRPSLRASSSKAKTKLIRGPPPAAPCVMGRATQCHPVTAGPS